MSPENTHKLMGFYMEGLMLGVNTVHMLFCSFKRFLIGCIGLITYCSIKLLLILLLPKACRGLATNVVECTETFAK